MRTLNAALRRPGRRRLPCRENSNGCLLEERQDCAALGHVCSDSSTPVGCVPEQCAGVENSCSIEGLFCNANDLLLCAPGQDGCLVATLVEHCDQLAAGTCRDDVSATAACVGACPGCPALDVALESDELTGADTFLDLAADDRGVLVLGATDERHILYCLSPATLTGLGQSPLDLGAAPPSGQIVLVERFAIIPGQPTLFIDRDTCTTVPSTLTLMAAAGYDSGGEIPAFFAVPDLSTTTNLIHSYAFVPDDSNPTHLQSCLPPNNAAPCIRPLCTNDCIDSALPQGSISMRALPLSGLGHPQLIAYSSQGFSSPGHLTAVDLDGMFTPLREVGTMSNLGLVTFAPLGAHAFAALGDVGNRFFVWSFDTHTFSHERELSSTVIDAAAVTFGTNGFSAILVDDGALVGFDLLQLDVGDQQRATPLQLSSPLAPVQHLAAVGSTLFALAGNRLVKLEATIH